MQYEPNKFVEDYTSDILDLCSKMKIADPWIKAMHGPIGGMIFEWLVNDLHIEIVVSNAGDVSFFWSHTKNISKLKSNDAMNLVAKLLGGNDG